MAADPAGRCGPLTRRWSAPAGLRTGDHTIAEQFRRSRGHRRRTGAERAGAPLPLDGGPPGNAPAQVLPRHPTGEPS